MKIHTFCSESDKCTNTKTFSHHKVEIPSTKKDEFSAKTVKTGEILNLINGVKKLE